jgi:hypothetical protein
MSSYARIIENQAVEIITPPAGHTLADCLHPSLVDQYDAIPNGIQVGATYDPATTAWTNPDTTAVAAPDAAPETVLAAARTNALLGINAAAQAALDRLAAGYPEREVATWDQQLAEANRVAVDPSLAADLAADAVDAIPLIRQMATARPSLGDTVADRILALAQRIRVNAASWSVAAGRIIGQRQALADAVEAATTPEAVADLGVAVGA